MKKSQAILLLSILLMAGSMFSSCEKELEQGGKTDPGDGEGTASLALKIKFDGMSLTRAEESTGLEAESQVTSLRFILYNSKGKAQYVDNYTIKYDDSENTWSVEAPSGKLNQGTLSITDQGVPELAVFPEIKKQDYQILVVVNPLGFDNNANLMMTYAASDATTVYAQTAEKGHDVSWFSQPIDLTRAFTGNNPPPYIENSFDPEYTIYYGRLGLSSFIGNNNFGYTLPENNDRVEYLAKNKDAFSNSYPLSFMMINADGLVEVKSENLAKTPAIAATTPVTVNVERGVAKVALFDELSAFLHNNAFIAGNVEWTTDILNYRSFLMRQKAPLSDGSPELATSPRKNRYALDPNYDGVSLERPGSGSTADIVKFNFYNTKAAIQSGTVTEDMLFYRQSNGATYDSDVHEWDYFDYLVENTMEAGEQYEDVTPRVVIRLNYVPDDAQVMPSIIGQRLAGGETRASTRIPAGTSYYSYKNKIIFTSNDMRNVAYTAGNINNKIETVKSRLSNPSEETINLLEELKTVLKDPDTRTAFGDFSAVPTTGVSSNGLNFHLAGMNYYYVLLRHFDNTIQPELMAYGRYGVVRNNVYKIVLTNINGPGAGVIPDPKGPDDKTDPVVSRIRVADWNGKDLNFTFN